MSTIFDSARLVKPATFAAGLATRRPRFEPSEADRQWAAETSPYRNLDFDVVGPSDDVIEEAAQEAAIRSAYEAGHRWH